MSMRNPLFFLATIVVILVTTICPSSTTANPNNSMPEALLTPAVTTTEDLYGIDPCNDELPTVRSQVHQEGPAVMAGPYKISAAAAAAYGTTPEKFGQTRVKAVPGTLEFDVQDMRYTLPDGSFGLRVIPTRDHGNITLADGSEVAGHQIVDETLRKASGLDDSDPLYVLAGFTHQAVRNCPRCTRSG